MDCENMARAFNRLKDLTVKRATKPGLYPDGAGLYLRVGPTGAKAWVFRYRRDGRLHDLGLGPLHTISLAAARQRAQKCREQRLDGIDPLEAKRAGRDAARVTAAKAMTFEDCAAAYIAAHQAAWSNTKHRKQWPATLTAYAYPVFGALSVQAVDTALVMKVLEPLWNIRTETASRLRGRIESVLDWAKTRGYREGDNPARWRGHLDNQLPKKSRVKPVEHLAALPYAEIVSFMAALRRREGVTARALEFLILTAARVGEVAGATWDEINRDERLWTIPANRMKGGREHRVPLSDAAMAVIEHMAACRQSDQIFPRRGAALLAVLRDLRAGNATIHGFRSSFRDWAAEIRGFPAEVAEMALAHRVGSAVEQAYRRSDLFARRRQLAEAWAAFCAGSPAGEVVPLPTRGQAGI
jgi:integrase